MQCFVDVCFLFCNSCLDYCMFPGTPSVSYFSHVNNVNTIAYVGQGKQINPNQTSLIQYLSYHNTKIGILLAESRSEQIFDIHIYTKKKVKHNKLH